MSDSTDEELASDVEELADVLRELREDLRPRRGPFGLPAPPTPGELLRFTDRRAIPFAIAVLEANVRALELLQGAIRLVQSGREVDAEARRTRDRAASLSRRSLERLEGVLSDLETSLGEGELPRQEEAREVLSEARRLRDEVEEALAQRVEEPPDGDTPVDPDAPSLDDAGIPGTDRALDGDGEGGRPDAGGMGEGGQPDVDVEGELRTIKEELGKLDDATAEEEPDATEEAEDESPNGTSGQRTSDDVPGGDGAEGTGGESTDGDGTGDHE